MRALVVALLCGAIGLSGLTVSSASATQTAKVVVQRLHRAIDRLPVATETRKGYDRSRFEHWVDGDGDCQDTRDEVLAAESLVAVSGCDIQRGKWLSYYDGVTTALSTGFDVDHLVPLAEAWDSGAKRWNDATRRRYANDLRDARTLVAVTASANRSKSDRDPAEWMPSLDACKYVRQWVAVKTRWRLTVDRAEKHALQDWGADCKNSTITVRRAVVRTASEGAMSSGSGGDLDPRFDYCYQANGAGYGPYHEGTDPEYDWYTDGDADGIACE